MDIMPEVKSILAKDIEDMEKYEYMNVMMKISPYVHMQI